VSQIEEVGKWVEKVSVQRISLSVWTFRIPRDSNARRGRGSKKRPKEASRASRNPPSKQVSHSQKKAVLSSQADGSSRKTRSESKSLGCKLKIIVKRPKKLASQTVDSTSRQPLHRLERVSIHREVQKSQSKDERLAFQESLFEHHAI
jgi:hypothetical protein